MAVLLRKYKRVFSILALSVAAVFMLSTVSAAYSFVFCKAMQKSEKRIVKSCCNPEGKEIEVKSEKNECNMDTQTFGVRIEKKDNCCCSVSKNEAPMTANTPAINTQNNQTKTHPGTVVYLLPDATYTITSTDILPRDKSPTQGRSITILVSNFRI